MSTSSPQMKQAFLSSPSDPSFSFAPQTQSSSSLSNLILSETRQACHQLVSCLGASLPEETTLCRSQLLPFEVGPALENNLITTSSNALPSRWLSQNRYFVFLFRFSSCESQVLCSRPSQLGCLPERLDEREQWFRVLCLNLILIQLG